MSLGALSMTEAAGQAQMGAESRAEYVTVTIADQLLGIPVHLVDDVLGPHQITQIPLANPAIAGVLNLRGRIVTAIDVRQRLGMPPVADYSKCMSIVVENKNEPYSLLVDNVGDVLAIDEGAYDANPPTLEDCWREVSRGIYQLEDRLLVVLDVSALLVLNTSAH